jgi:hypothetical protein
LIEVALATGDRRGELLTLSFLNRLPLLHPKPPEQPHNGNAETHASGNETYNVRAVQCFDPWLSTT